MHKVLIIGCGNIAGGLDADRPADALPFTHAGAFVRHGGFQIVGCVDPDEAQRHSFAQRWSVPAGTAELGALGLAPGSIDVVSICSPTVLHDAHVLQALALRPRAVFCEKPVAGTFQDAERLVARCASAGAKLGVNYTRRWAPDVVRLAEELRAGDWGEVRSAIGLYTKGVVHNGGHMIDLLQLLLGELDFVAAGAPAFDHWPDDPTVPALLATSGGVPVQLVPGDTRDYAVFELTLLTEKGTIAMLDAGRRWSLRRAEVSSVFSGYTVLGEPEFVAGRYDEAMLAAVVNLADALECNVPMASSGANALAAQRLCETIRNASLQRTKQ